MTKSKIRDRFLARFRGLMRAFGTYQIERLNQAKGKVEGRARTRQEPVTPTLWDEHLAGKQSLGIVPIDDSSNCYFGAIDVDVYDGLDLPDLDKKIRDMRLPLIVCRTKSGGAHLYLFGSEPIPAKIIRSSLQEFAIILGFAGVEIFPKQVQLAGPDDVGNWINLPYFGGSKTDRFAIVKGKKASPESFLDFADKTAVTTAELQSVKLPELPLLEEAPPCLQHLARKGFPQGTRNNAIFSLGIYAQKAFDDDWERRLEELNRKFLKPPLVAREIMSTAVSLSKKNYSYKCKDEPLVSVCNRSICVTRRFGIGGSNDPGVTFGGLSKIDTNPPTWIVDVDGVRVEINSTSDILNQDRFRVLCMEKLNRLPSRVQGNAWDDIIQGLLARVEVIEAPEDAGPEGQFRSLLDKFVTDQAQARNKEELIMGKPWREGDRIYFQGSAFIKYLEDNRFREITSSKAIWAVLRKIGATDKQFNIKSKCVRTWSVPSSLFPEIDGDLEVPRVAEREDF